MGRTEFLTWNRLRGEPWLVEQKQNLPRERNGALRSARPGAPQKCLTAPTLLETPDSDSYRSHLPRDAEKSRPNIGRHNIIIADSRVASVPERACTPPRSLPQRRSPR